MNLNAGYWDTYIHARFARQIGMFWETVEKRLLATFDEIENEAEAVADGRWDDLCSSSLRPDTDLASLAERAFDAGLGHYEMLAAMRQALMNLTATAMYHLFEQQLLCFYRRELQSQQERNDKKSVTLETTKSKLCEQGIEIKTFASWPVIDELRWVANAVKHGEGTAAKRLRRVRPDLFSDPAIRKLSWDSSAEAASVYMPLAGEDLHLSEADLQKYCANLLQFWDEFAAALISAEDTLPSCSGGRRSCAHG